ncbi:LysR family transcriptional regulator [Escherichia coli]
MNYSLKQLKVFVTVAQEKSFSRAGERIGLSQSAVSHSVKELENHTGVRLLDRTTREVVLTDAGQQLALRLERLLDELNSTLRDTGDGEQLSGKVRVAASQTISAHLIPQCIAESHRRYPDPVRPARSSAAVGDGKYSPGRCRLWHRHRSRPSGDLQCEAILSEPFFLLCHRDSALAAEDYVPWQALQGAKLVLQDYALRQPTAD